MFRDAGFDTLAASPAEDLFVGLSNMGLDGTAVLVFDRDGNVWLQAYFWTARFDYCDESISLVRKWHGSEPQDVHFEQGDSLAGISLLDCRGNRVNLLQVVKEAFERHMKEARDGESWAKKPEK